MPKPPTQLTAGHRILHRKLNELGLILEDEVQVGRYVLDMYCRDYHLGFEFDGPLHDTPSQRAKDRVRDKWLLDRAGVPVLRVSGNGVRDPGFALAAQTWVTGWCATLNDRRQRGDEWPLHSLV